MSWLVFIAEAGFASWQPSAPRKSRVGFWITSEFRHARLRWRRPSSSNFPSPSNDHGQLKLRIGVSPSCCITPSHRAYFHPPPEKLRQTCAALAPSQHKTHYVTSPHSAKPRRWPPDTCGMAFEKLILIAVFVVRQGGDPTSSVRDFRHQIQAVVFAQGHVAQRIDRDRKSSSAIVEARGRPAEGVGHGN